MVKNLPKLTDMLGLFPKLPDVFCVSETKVWENRYELINISGYNFLFKALQLMQEELVHT